MQPWIRILVPLFLAGQGLLVYRINAFERPPRPPALSQFPSMLNGWNEWREDPLDAAIANILQADALLSRTYMNSAGESAQLLVAWFQSQRAGTSQPHSPKVCLPASGWSPESNSDMTIYTHAGAITVNRYVVSSRDDRAVVLYWYQSGRRAVAGEWASKFWLLADAVHARRTDTSLVRIVVESARGDDDRATTTAAAFARSIYPLLLHQLQR